MKTRISAPCSNNRIASLVRKLLVPIQIALSAMLLSSCVSTGSTNLADQKYITIGTLYAAKGQFEASSMAEYLGLEFWVSQVNTKGGIFIKALGHKLKVKLVSYNDSSSPNQAAILYKRLINVDHVNFLVSDFGSVLTQPAIKPAELSQVLLFDQSGSGSALFSQGNPYLVLCDLPTSAIWPLPLSNLLLTEHLSRVAIIYSKNDFDTAQDQTVADVLTKNNMAPIANIAVGTSQRSYDSAINQLELLDPQALIEFGYQNNDTAFLNQLHNSKLRPEFVFTAFPGQLHQLLQKDVGTAGLAYTFTYAFPPNVRHKRITMGPSVTSFETEFSKAMNAKANFLNIAGFNTGLIFQAAAEKATTFTQLGMRDELNNLSGHMRTLEGEFQINSEGAQIGETLGVAELFPTASGGTANESVFPLTSQTTTIRLGNYGRLTSLKN